MKIHKSALTFKQMIRRLFRLALIYPTILFFILFIIAINMGRPDYFYFFAFYLSIVLFTFLYYFLIKKYHLVKVILENNELRLVYYKLLKLKSVSLRDVKLTYEFVPDYFFQKRLTIYVNGDKLMHEHTMKHNNLQKLAEILDMYMTPNLEQQKDTKNERI